MSGQEAVKHTAGPWKWGWRDDEIAPGSVYAEPHQGHAYAIAMMPRYQTKEQWAADASLMAAAPDMLAAGNEMADAAGDIHPTAPSNKSIKRLHRAINGWCAAIAKATGA